MAGFFCNEQGEYVETPSLRSGHWYFHRDLDQLFIISDDSHGISDNVGVEGDLLDAIQSSYKGVKHISEVDQNKVAELLDLEVVQDYQKAHDPDIGYYFN